MSDLIQPTPVEQNALRENLARLTAEFAATQRLQAISIQMSRNGELDVLYGQILDAAVAIMESDFASIQMFDPSRGAAGELGLLGSRGFSADATRFWEWVRADSNSSCGMAFRTRQRCIVKDVEQCDFMTGTDDLAAYRETGIRAVQTTPLLSRDGELVGMISTHWRAAHAPSERDLRLFDLLARQAADLIEYAKSREQMRTLVEELRDSDRRKDEFLATLSHELRNPLAPLRNALHLLRSAENRDARAAPIHEMMERQVNHLVRLVDDLLELSRINRGALELRKERVQAATVVRHAVETSDHLIRERRHQLDLSLPEAPLWIDGDPVRLAQVIANLLNNAAKYTEPAGRIALEVRSEAGNARIAVRDNGDGIAPDHLGRVFDMFHRSERTAGSGGLGVGLSLARRLVELHGGTITAYSNGVGQGSEFIVQLPLATELQAESTAEIDSTPLPQQRILVVDDNRDGGDSLKSLLETLGMNVRLARNGPEALAIIEEYLPEVVLLDIGMPGMDGYETARRIRSASGIRQPAIVALTGWGQPEDRRRSREAGFDHHLIKPADMNVLQTLLRSLHKTSTK